ncbi:MAG: gamma-glutamylcyclotransferase [Treponema sp.]|nr:gamma-glutamylcyclotransferase [Treponema sp.]
MSFQEAQTPETKKAAVLPDGSPQRLFVYGSLMEGFFNYEKVFSGKVLSRTPARVRGILYHQIRKGYPAMIPGGGWVRGEFLELEDFPRLLAASDDIENYFGETGNNEYERRLSPLELLPEGIPAFAHVYWYGRSDLGSAENPTEIIPSGDWRDYMLHRERKGG